MDVVVETFGKPGDTEAFVALNLAWLRELFGGEEEEDINILSNPERSILSKGGIIIMARQNGVAVGTCALVPIDAEAAEFAKMGVDKSMRGKGVGRKMMDFALEQARRMGKKKILICTHDSLGAALKIYQDAGFVPSTDHRHHMYERTNVFLEKTL